MQTSPEVISVSDLSVILYPELIAASLCANESDLYALWSVLKGIDRYRGGSGQISSKWLLDITQTILGLNQSRAYTKLKQGVGLYWNKFGKSKEGTKVTCLIGEDAVIERLSPTITRSEPFQCTVRYVESENIGEIKSLMISMVAARYVDNRAVSIASIVQQTGQSERTVQKALRNCVDLKSTASYEQISIHNTEQAALKAFAKIQKVNPAAYTIEKHLDQFVICKRAPNLYALTQPKRLPLSKRPKALRRRDLENASGLGKKRYYPLNSKKPVEHEHVVLSDVRLLPTGTAVIWTKKNAKKPKTPPPPKQSVAGRWQDIKRGSVRKPQKAHDNRNITTNVSI